MWSISTFLRHRTTTSTASAALRARERSVTLSRSSPRTRRTTFARSRKQSANDCHVSRFQISITTRGRKGGSRFRLESGSLLSVVGRQRRERDRKPKPIAAGEAGVQAEAEGDGLSQSAAERKSESRPTDGHVTAGAARC